MNGKYGSGGVLRGEVGIVRGEIIPQDLDITTERAGTAERAAAIRHVEEVMKLGYLPGDEAGRRVNYLKNATTKRQIRESITDLPAMRVKKKRNLDDLTVIPLPVLLVLLSAFISTAVLGGVIMGAAEPHPSIGMYLLTISMLVTGIIGAVTSFVTILVKANV